MKSKFLSALDEFIDDHPVLNELREVLTETFWILVEAAEQGRTLFTCGNGGSAADAEHIVGELMKSYAYHRPIPKIDADRLERCFGEEGRHMAGCLEAPIRAVALTEGSVFTTADVNNVGYQYGFAQRLYGLATAGDVLITISTSGNSTNLVAAARLAQAFGVKVIALTGSKPGQLDQCSDVCVKVPAYLTHKIQELHLPIYHFLCFALEQHFFAHHGAKQNAIETSPNNNVCTDASVKPDVSTVIFDFDGVMTDNHLWLNAEGEEWVRCDRADGLGIEQLKNVGIRPLILSTESHPVVSARARKLGIESIQGCGDKGKWVAEWLVKEELDSNKVAYVGNDINDLTAMQQVGITLCPADSHHEVRRISQHVLPTPGGHGVVRAVATLLGGTDESRLYHSR